MSVVAGLVDASRNRRIEGTKRRKNRYYVSFRREHLYTSLLFRKMVNVLQLPMFVKLAPARFFILLRESSALKIDRESNSEIFWPRGFSNSSLRCCSWILEYRSVIPLSYFK